jgi:hypothetical protein
MTAQSFGPVIEGGDPNYEDGPPLEISAEAFIRHLQRRFAAQFTQVTTTNAEQAAVIEQLQAMLTESQSRETAAMALVEEMRLNITPQPVTTVRHDTNIIGP